MHITQDNGLHKYLLTAQDFSLLPSDRVLSWTPCINPSMAGRPERMAKRLYLVLGVDDNQVEATAALCNQQV